ncbi:astacin-like metalloendopeptidase [Danio aesculapii]|uniref:astacin-like metalloendopeptidase n=1 Tax=Danio aesculapii TaxID=1142201 RepID=UPI0024C0115A|nr:astacin-like metalloendopeptidase [Danio aesculapii]
MYKSTTCLKRHVFLASSCNIPRFSTNRVVKMLGLLLLFAWLCEVQGGPVKTQNTSEVQVDEGYHRHSRQSETSLDSEESYAIVEEDIILTRDRNAGNQLWPEKNGQVSVPYSIASGLRQEYILAALKMISKKTCVKFHQRTTEEDYLQFKPDSMCASLVGCSGGEQPILVGPKCNAGNICHEILHSLGLYHEHSRPDRDKYITIMYDNIMPGKESNFKVKKGNTLGLEYDLESILHYGDDCFSRNGNPTIIPKKKGVKIGQRTHMSVLDVERLRRLYHCDD